MVTKQKDVLVCRMTVGDGRRVGVIEENSNQDRFCGIWECDGKHEGKSYLKITKENSGVFKFSRRYKCQDKAKWPEYVLGNANGFYLRPSSDGLQGESISSNYYATHGMEFEHGIILQMKSYNMLLYSVWSSIRGETDISEATKISN